MKRRAFDDSVGGDCVRNLFSQITDSLGKTRSDGAETRGD